MQLITAPILTIPYSLLQAFMGEVAMWTGLVTGTLMFASPVLFDRLGWRGVAGATPIFMLWAGMPFFAGVVLYTLLPSTAATTVGPAMLKTLVIVGAVVQVGVIVAVHSVCCCVFAVDGQDAVVNTGIVCMWTSQMSKACCSVR